MAKYSGELRSRLLEIEVYF